MAGMEALGRLFNVVGALGSGNTPIKFRGASGIAVVVSGSTAVVTVNERSSFSGGDTAIFVIKNVYWTTATNATVAWSKLAFNLAVAPYLTGGPSSGPGPLSTYTHGTTTGLTTATLSVFHIFTSQLSDPNNYVNVVITGSGSGYAIPYDLVSARGPANLEVMGA